MAPKSKCPLCLECGGVACVVSAKLLVTGWKRRTCRCKICERHVNIYTYEGLPTSFEDFLKNVKRPPERLTALAMFSETLVIWREVNAD